MQLLFTAFCIVFILFCSTCFMLHLYYNMKHLKCKLQSDFAIPSVTDFLLNLHKYFFAEFNAS